MSKLGHDFKPAFDHVRGQRDRVIGFPLLIFFPRADMVFTSLARIPYQPAGLEQSRGNPKLRLLCRPPFQRLIQTHALKESIIVNRAVRSIEYEMTLARNKGLSKKFLFHDGFVYTSLLNAYSGQIHLNILIPKGTPYLYIGIFSNTVGSYPSEENQTIEDTVGKLILDIGTILKIDRKRRHGGITIYDVHVDNTHSSVIK